MKKFIIFIVKVVKKLFKKSSKKEEYVSGKSDEIYPLF
jgi:hypothetical protein